MKYELKKCSTFEWLTKILLVVEESTIKGDSKDKMSENRGGNGASKYSFPSSCHKKSLNKCLSAFIP